MASVGLKDLYIAKVTEKEGLPDEYGTPRRLAKAIKADMSVEVAEAILYADDGAAEVVKEFVSGELKLNVDDISQEDMAELLGQEIDGDGVVFAGDNDNPPYYAVGFRAKKPRGMYKYLWLFKVKFGIPDEEYETKGDKIDFKTPEIIGQIIKRPDGHWKADHVALPDDPVATGWFTKVREKKPRPAQPAEG